jgi:hypothetical protein
MSPLEWVLREFLVGSRLGFALAFVVRVAVELPGATLGATGGAVPWEGKPLRGHV